MQKDFDRIIIVLREVGKKFDQDKPMVDLLVPEFLEDVAKVMTQGAKKYGLENWKKGLESRRLLAALYRHALAYHRGEKIDPESGLSHLCHITCNAMFLYWYDKQPKKRYVACDWCAESGLNFETGEACPKCRGAGYLEEK